MSRIRTRTIHNETEYRRMVGMPSEMMNMDLPQAMDRLLQLHELPQENADLSSDSEEDSDDDAVFMNMGFFNDGSSSATSPKKFQRRISFEDHVEVREIPSAVQFDEATKRSMWYTREEFCVMRKKFRRGIM